MTCPICDCADPELTDLLAEQIVEHHRDLATKVVNLMSREFKD